MSASAAEAQQLAIDAAEAQIRLLHANRMPGRTVADVLRMARERHARAVISFDPTLPNGLRFELQPLEIPAFLAAPPASRHCPECAGEGLVGAGLDIDTCSNCFGTGFERVPA